MTTLGSLALAVSTLTPAQQSIAHAPATGPTSYAGNEWLIMINLGFSTSLAIVGAFISWQLAGFLWRNRRHDRWNHPVTCFRTIMLLLALGVMIRKGAAAAVLWKWNPADPVGTSYALAAQRFLDPVADIFQAAAFGLMLVTVRALVDQLRRLGWDIPIWQSLPMLKRPAIFTLMSFAAAAGVVLTR